MRETTVEVPGIGTFVLTSPKAGARNKAMAKAESPEGIKQTILAIELLPACIKTHPFGTKYPTLREALDDLELDQYDLLLKALASVILPPGAEVEKKSEQ